jgi:DNA-binding beta-propeller fold protein YncE
MSGFITLLLISFFAAGGSVGDGTAPTWPPPPDTARVEFVTEIRVADLKPKQGVFGKVLNLVGGSSDEDKLQLPFDVVVFRDKLYLTCQETPALVEIDPESNRFRLYECESGPFRNPLALCASADAIYMTDSENEAVYIFDGKEVEPLITEGLRRPTGIAWVSEPPRLYVVDTGNHSVEMFDRDGRHQGSLGGRGSAGAGFNYPTFATARDSLLLVNDTLNYRIKFFTAGGFVTSIGEEGDGPGTFARPKGVAVDARGHVYVVDSLFDNVQVFDPAGRILLVIGSAGNDAGQFWSPAGIDIAGNMIYIADTFNHRIQVLRIIEG